MLNNSSENLFQCQLKDQNNFISHLRGDFLPNEGEISFGSYVFQRNILLEEIDFIIRYIRKQWIFIQNLVLIDRNVAFKDILSARQDVNKGLSALIQCVSTSENNKKFNQIVLDSVCSLSASILPLESFSDKILMRLRNITEQNANCPVCHYFHTYLDINFYTILIRIKCECPRNVMEENISKVMKGFVTLCRKHFSIENSSLLCPCFNNVWLFLHIILKEQFGCDIFWDKLNEILKDEDALFALWLLKDLVNLKRFNEDIQNAGNLMLVPTYDFIREKMKTAVNTSVSILNHLKMMYPLITDLWLNENLIDLFLLLWDYFGKHLNLSKKYQTGFYLSSLTFTDVMDNIMYSPMDCDEEFELFIGLLLKYLKHQPNHWSKIKCRIFSQLSPFKVAELEDVGIYRVFQLFIALMQVNKEELSKKIVSIYGNLKEKTITTTIINLYISFIIKHVRENMDIEKITSPLVKTLQHASENQNNFLLIKEFFHGLQHVVQNSADMKLHQWTLLDSWTIKYLATCYSSDLEDALRIILTTVKKINSDDAWAHWEVSLKKHIYPVLKQIGNTSLCPSIVGELAGELSISSVDFLTDLFNFFNAETMNFKITERYLCTVLKYYPTNISLTQIQEKNAIQSWIRICLYSAQDNKEITLNIMKLESIPDCIKKKIDETSEDSLYTFIEFLGENKSLFITSTVLSRFCEVCFENLDQSLVIYLPQIKNDAVICRVYTYLSITILKCGTLLYDRHKTSCSVTKLISCLLFPTEFIMGKISHPFLEAIRKTWQIFFEGILKLGPDNDTYVQRTLRDLISKYLPHFSVGDSPVYTCLARETSANVILEKFSTIYFKHPTKETEQNVIKALKILHEFIKSTTSVNLLKIAVTQTLFGLCEVYIFHNQRNLALTIILHFVASSFYEELKEDILKSLLLLTEKHLAFNSKSYFKLIDILAKAIPGEILILKESIVEKIKNIERIRGIGYDDNLRSYLGTLNATLKC